MRGELGILACPLLMLLCVVVLSLGSGVDTEGATTYIDGDWYISDDTILRDGTWAVNGSVSVEGCLLTLDGAELVLNYTGSSMPGLIVAEDARLSTTNSEIRGNYIISLDIRGNAHLDNTSICNMTHSSSGGVRHSSGDLTLDHCQLYQAYYTIVSFGNLTVRGCQFIDFGQYGIRWNPPYASEGFKLVVEDSNFINTRGYYNGNGIEAFQGGSTFDDNHVMVTGCYFNGLSYAITVSDFESGGDVLVERNMMDNCSVGLSLSSVGPMGTVRLNRWNASNSGVAIQMDTSDTGPPDINNETVTGGSYGIYISGSYDRVILWDIDIKGVNTAVYCYSGYVDIHHSTVRSSSYNFRITRGFIHLHDCNHQYTALVSSYYGEVSEPVIVNVTQVTWQEGTPISEGVTEFENETGEYITERDNEFPTPITLATWMMTYRDNLTIERVRGMYYKDGLEFRSAPFEVAGLSRMELVIVDNSTPEVEISNPEPEDLFEAVSLTFKGNYSERGVGMGRIRVTYNGTEWLPATLFDDGKWRLRFEDLPNGILTFTVNISDRAGNSLEVTVPNITIDTIWPIIQLKLPGQYVASSPTQLIARTEPRARAFVNYQEVDVMPDGWFSALVPLFTGANEVHIRVVDVVGHENYTLIKVNLDTTEPALLVETPQSGLWTNRAAVQVSGMTEADCRVFINGAEAEMDDHRFNVIVSLEEGANQITVISMDMAANQATVKVTVVRDSEAPQLDVQVPEDGYSTRFSKVMVSGSVSDTNIQRVLVNNLSADLVMGHFYREVSLVPGENTIIVVASDPAGNEARADLVVHADFETPVITARLKSDESTYLGYDGPVTIQAHSVLVEVQASERVDLRVMGRNPLTIGPGKHTEEVLLDPGRNEIVVQAEDMVGNVATPITLVVYQDSVTPELSVDVTDDVVYSKSRSFLVSGSTEPGCQVTVGGIPAPVLFDGFFALSIELEEGPNSIRVTSTDSVGNEAIQVIQVVYEPEDEAGTISGWTTVLAGAILGLVAGLVAALIVTRGRARSPPHPPNGPAGPEEGSPQGQMVPPTSQEMPGQLPRDEGREPDDWEMM